MMSEASLLFHLLFLVGSLFIAVCEALVQHAPLWGDNGELTSLPEVYFAECVIKAPVCSCLLVYQTDKQEFGM